MNQRKFENAILTVDGMRDEIESLLADFNETKPSMMALTELNEEQYTRYYGETAVKMAKDKISDNANRPSRFRAENCEKWIASLCVGLILLGELEF